MSTAKALFRDFIADVKTYWRSLSAILFVHFFQAAAGAIGSVGFFFEPIASHFFQQLRVHSQVQKER